jgi:uncharacterized protein DUF4339
MQESAVNQHDAERVGPSWYLCRDGQQHGPLTDQELSQFAKGGNFQPNDLLWTQGLDSWKPAAAIFGLTAAAQAENAAGGDASDQTTELTTDQASEPTVQSDDESVTFELEPDVEPQAQERTVSDHVDLEHLAPDHVDPDHADPEPVEPTGEDVTALVQALKGEKAPATLTWKERALEELKAFAGMFIYLWIVFTVFLVHEWIVLSDNHIGFTFYGLATLNALGLGKIMLVAQHFRFAEQLQRKPLIYPIAYKTVAFTTLLLVAYVLEVMLVGWIAGHGFLASMPALGGSLVGTVALWLIFCAALLPFFAFKEFERAVGAEMVWKLLLGTK